MASDSTGTGDQSNTQAKEPTLGLPAPPSSNDVVHELDVSRGGSTVRLDHLGPMVVNQDGTLSRVANWGQMSELEQKNAMRVLGKRNKLRTAALQAQESESAQQSQ